MVPAVEQNCFGFVVIHGIFLASFWDFVQCRGWDVIGGGKNVQYQFRRIVPNAKVVTLPFWEQLFQFIRASNVPFAGVDVHFEFWTSFIF